MHSNLRCIALRTVKYDDRHNILTAWSAERGRVGIVVPAGASREACRLRALLMPLSLFEGDADIKPSFDLIKMRGIRPLAVLPSISSDPSKAVVAMFIAEVLDKILRDTPADAYLYDFIFQSVTTLDSLTPRGVAGFPIVFLCRLSGFLGIEPDVSEWSPGKFFDMTEGLYRTSAPLLARWLMPAEAAVAAMVQRLSYYSAARLFLPRQLRRSILDSILEYYSIHLTPLDSLRSLHVVRDLL